MKEKRITLLQRMSPIWAHGWGDYVADVVESQRHSVLVGLPAREYTEVSEDLSSGDIVIRYIEKPPPKRH